MAAVQAMTGGGGWPMSVFLTPDGKPFYGGTYFPPQPAHSLPAFRQVLAGVAKAWHDERDEVLAAGGRMVATLIEQNRLTASGADSVAGGPGVADGTADDASAAPIPQPTRELLDAATAAIEASFDTTNGGWGGAPKFPQPMTIEYLLRRAVTTGDPRPLAVARRSLDAMADGGIHDQLGGGFHRYSTDAKWLVPHFEKMLYDNAQLARVYIHAWALTGDRRYRDVTVSTLDYLTGELRTSDCGFAASQDADTDGVEGATFVWTAEEIRDVVGAEEISPIVAMTYGVKPEGNWEGKTILSRIRSAEEVAAMTRLPVEEVRLRLAWAGDLLRDRRASRPQPARDDKVLAAWNGLAIAAFADAARLLSVGDNTPDLGRSESFLKSAISAANGVLAGLLRPDGRLGRSWKDGRSTGEGVLEDYADLADGLLALYEATFDERWFVTARQLADAILEHFVDPDGGFFDTADDHETLITRPKDVQDNAVPAGGSAAAAVLLKLAALTGESRFRAAAERAIATVLPYLARYPTGFANWLSASHLAVEGIDELAIAGPPDDEATKALLAVAATGFRPNLVLALSADPSASAVPLLEGRELVDGHPTAYVCRDFACRLPVTDPVALRAQLGG